MKELGFRNLEYDEKEGVRNRQVILKEAEQARLKKESALGLLARGFQSDRLKIHRPCSFSSDKTARKKANQRGVSTVLTIQNSSSNCAQT
jgi:hypothetical protein